LLAGSGSHEQLSELAQQGSLHLSAVANLTPNDPAVASLSPTETQRGPLVLLRQNARLAFVGVALVAAVASGEHGELDFGLWSTIVWTLLRELGVASIVAYVIALVVEHKLRREAMIDVARFALGWALPEELRGEMLWLFGQQLMSRELDIDIHLQPNDDSETVTLSVRVRRSIENISSSPSNSLHRVGRRRVGIENSVSYRAVQVPPSGRRPMGHTKPCLCR